MIDDVTRDNPVFVSRLDWHMAVANSVALKIAGITRETPDPPGGTIVRDASGEPTGLLKDAAMDTRRTIDGRNPNGWIPEQRITVEEALRAYTVSNAWAMFAENEVGRIAPGLFADIVVLSQDLFTIAPEKIVETKVDVTIFDGRVIHER